MKPENNSYTDFREKHAALESAQQHVRDLEAALLEMKSGLEDSKAKLLEVQARDAGFLAAAMTAKADRSKCVRCQRGLGDAPPPMCSQCAMGSRNAVEAVELSTASISGTQSNLAFAEGEVQTAHQAETAAFEKWISAEYASESEKLTALLEKAFAVASRIDGLSSVGNRRRFRDHINGRGGFQGPLGLCQRISVALLALAPRQTSTQRNSLEAVQLSQAAKVAEECFEKPPSGKKRPEAPPAQSSAFMVVGGPLSVGDKNGEKI